MADKLLTHRALFYWNGALVCVSECSETMAIDQTRAFLRENFAGIDHGQAMIRQAVYLGPSVQGLTKGDCHVAGYEDDTGSALVRIKKL